MARNWKMLIPGFPQPQIPNKAKIFHTAFMTNTTENLHLQISSTTNMLFYVNSVTIFPPVTARFELKNAFVVVVISCRQIGYCVYSWCGVGFILLGHLRLSAFFFFFTITMISKYKHHIVQKQKVIIRLLVTAGMVLSWWPAFLWWTSALFTLAVALLIQL